MAASLEEVNKLWEDFEKLKNHSKSSKLESIDALLITLNTARSYNLNLP